MRRVLLHSLVSRIRAGLDLLDAQLSRLGRYGSTAALTGVAVCAALGLQVMLRLVEGLNILTINLFNVAIVVALVVSPLILYSRELIDELRRSRGHLDVMSRRLHASVDQAEAANKAKSAFLASMSHELRTPLNAIMGFSEVMMDEHLGPLNNPRYAGYAADIHTSGRHLLGIINDILDLSKIEAGKMSLETASEFPLAGAVDASLGMVAPLAEKYGVRLASTVAQDGLRLHAVERMVHQILINLLGNAIKFTPAGGEVHVSGMTTAGGGYALQVRDSGIGMTEVEIAKALTPFGQVENKLTATHTGTGLGLPLAKAMVELHDGAMTVTSIPHVGTTITLHFPASRMARAQAAAAA